MSDTWDFMWSTYVTILACTTIEIQLTQTKASNLNKDRRAPATRLRNLLELQNITVLPSFKVWPRKDPSWLLWPLASVPRNSRRINLSKLASFHPISQRYPRALFEELLRRKILQGKTPQGPSDLWHQLQVAFYPNLSSLWQGWGEMRINLHRW